MSWIQRAMSARRPCIRSMSTMEAFQAIKCGEIWSKKDALDMQKRFSELGRASSSCHDEGVHAHTSLERKKANGHLKYLFPFQNASFSKESQLASKPILGTLYIIFGFEPLHNLHVGISKLLKECTFKSFVWIEPSGIVKQRKLLSQMEVSKQLGMNSVLATTDRNAGTTGLHVDFSSKGRAMQLIGYLHYGGNLGILERKDYLAEDIIFTITGAYINRETWFRNGANMTGFLCMYSNIVSKIVSRNYGRGCTVAELETLRKNVCAFKHQVLNMFLLACTSGLCILKFHILDHLIEDISKFESKSAFDTLP